MLLSVVFLVTLVPMAWGQSTTGSTGTGSTATKSPAETLLATAKKVEGMWTMYYKDQQVLAELKTSDLSKNYIVITSIAKGISRMPVLGGMSWGFGDDAVWTFKKVGDKLQVIRRNVRFRATAGSPEASAVQIAYNDSVLYALPIIPSTGGNMLVDFTRIFMSDDEMIGRSIGASFAPDRSTVSKVKAFRDNVEIQIGAVYSSLSSTDTVPDPRGMQVTVHYSISTLPSTGYKPRVADDRIGYFLTALKDFSDKKDDQQFIRYINRWNLQKADADAKLSPPKEPIIFHIEKSVPIALRPVVRSGIEEWNKAFEKLGFANAIEVRQQREDDDWDPEDIRYNTFRWITANAGFAMGPSRVNPMTGQILDADIIFDADFLRFWKMEYETFSPQSIAEIFGDPPAASDKASVGSLFGGHHHHGFGGHCGYCASKQHSMGFAASVLATRADVSARGKVPEAFVHQGLKEVVMHEVGHTLGLRHNFKASSWKTTAEVNDPVKGAAEGTVASVMDYAPANIAPKGQKQGLYYTQTLGPYDIWAIEYGYKVISGDETTELKKIASRSAEPGLDYATDEDTRGTIDSDPLVNRFDMGKDPIDFAKREMAAAAEAWGKVAETLVEDGEGYQRARQAFGMLFSQYWKSLSYISRFPGGVHVHRDHKGDPKGRAPFVVVEPAKQRQAMKILSESAFRVPAIPPEMLNYLATTRWSHWGMRDVTRVDYPVHDQVSLMQSRILFQLLSSNVLTRLADNEFKTRNAADAYTLAEHLNSIVDGVFTEALAAPKAGDYSRKKPYVDSLRRNLQRTALRSLSSFATTGPTASEDVRTLSRMHLVNLDKKISSWLDNSAVEVVLDDYTKAHFLDMKETIRRALNTTVVIPASN